MKTILRPTLICLFVACLAGSAGQYSVDWYKISGGGGTSTGATYQITGTIGQPEAGGNLAGGQYSVNGGFWSLISVVQTPGLPNLSISHTGNTICVWWPTTPNCTLEEIDQLGHESWDTADYPITTNNGTCSITITQPVGTLFFRLKR